MMPKERHAEFIEQTKEKEKFLRVFFKLPGIGVPG